MTTLPTWIDDRIDPAFDKKLTQRHVVEVMLESDRPFFSIQQLRSRVSPTVSKETVRNRLNELREIDVVAAETYPETITLYYINHPESNWPLSPAGQQALAVDSPLETLSLTDFLRLRNPAGIRTLVLAGFQLSLLLFCVGVGMAVLTIEAPVEASHGLWVAAGNLFVVCLVLLGAERLARKVRDDGLTRAVPTADRSGQQ
ncbi:helix-turn-helix domain-containing protein [Natrinema ejinorense]|uniref:Uncharacterized protein n=1 Tax=Natrinema ejinorense TaxID=373386 RepID=A0A2A5QWU1_9EURY|nr:hypothetical protein [Natrinema ejinorense]PCR91219.1 hypothetical protein CP557_12195 [Natrinema ejinorense]